MNKTELEAKLQQAFDQGFWPKEVIRYHGASPLRIVYPEGESDRIVAATRTTESDGRQHEQRLIYSLEEAQKLLDEYNS